MQSLVDRALRLCGHATFTVLACLWGLLVSASVLGPSAGAPAGEETLHSSRAHSAAMVVVPAEGADDHETLVAVHSVVDHSVSVSAATWCAVSEHEHIVGSRTSPIRAGRGPPHAT